MTYPQEFRLNPTIIPSENQKWSGGRDDPAPALTHTTSFQQIVESPTLQVAFRRLWIHRRVPIDRRASKENHGERFQIGHPPW